MGNLYEVQKKGKQAQETAPATAVVINNIPVINLYCRKDPHRTLRQVPLDKVDTWKKLQNYVLERSNEFGEVVFYDDNHTVIESSLWSAILKDGATFGFLINCQISITVTSTSSTTAKRCSMLHLGFSDALTIYELRKKIHQKMLDHGWRTPQKLSSIVLELHRIFNNTSISEVVLRDNRTVMDYIKDDEDDEDDRCLYAFNIEPWTEADAMIFEEKYGDFVNIQDLNAEITAKAEFLTIAQGV